VFANRLESSELLVVDRQRDIELLASIPMGGSCAAQMTGLSPAGSLFDLLLDVSDELRACQPGVVYLAMGADDFVPLSQIAATSEQWRAAIDSADAASLAGWLLAGCEEVTDRGDVEAAFKFATQDALDPLQGDIKTELLVDLFLKICSVLPSVPRIRKTVLQMMCSVLSEVLHVEVSSVELQLYYSACRLGRLFVSELHFVVSRYCQTFATLHRLLGLHSDDKLKSSLTTNVAVVTSIEQDLSALSLDREELAGRGDAESNAVIVTPSSIGASSSSDCKAMIARFLQTEFKYGPDGQRPRQDEQTDNIKNALTLLSDNLYTSNVHFVMELLQNADDNTYLEGVVPQLKFQLSGDALCVFNNEKGFRTEDIRSICRVGGSTKTSHTGTYIGQKGIGFKSVFTVSDCPEIHSNGEHQTDD
jgi:hypothetical protein